MRICKWCTCVTKPSHAACCLFTANYIRNIFIGFPQIFTFYYTHRHHTRLDRNDAVEILIMILNRQIISWSINHRRRNHQNLFTSDFVTEKKSLENCEREMMSAKIESPKGIPYHVNIFVSILWMKKEKRVQNSFDD